MPKIDELTLAMLAKQRPTVGCWVRFKYNDVGVICARCLHASMERDKRERFPFVRGSSFVKCNHNGVFKPRKCGGCRVQMIPFNDERSRGQRHGRTECPMDPSPSTN